MLWEQKNAQIQLKKLLQNSLLKTVILLLIQLVLNNRSVPIVMALVFTGAHCRPSTPAIVVEAALQLRIGVRSVPVVPKI